MDKVLFGNACARPCSRTYELARHVLDRLPGQVEGLDLAGANPAAILERAKQSVRFIGLCFFFTGLSAVLCLPLFSLEFLHNPIDYTEFAGVLDVMLSVVPSDILTPFLEGNSPALILLALSTGSIIQAHGKNAFRLL